MYHNICLKDHGYNFGGTYYDIFLIFTKLKSQSHGNNHSSTRVSSISKEMAHAYLAYYSSTIVNDRSHLLSVDYNFRGFFFKFEEGLTAGVTGQQRMLTPPRHPIVRSHLSEVRVALHSIL
jgi:hypothetical protein